jgi:extracellular elastinolytic metalloproteinase
MRYFRAATAVAAIAAMAAFVPTDLQAQGARQFEPPPARIVRAERGQVLSAPSTAAPAAIVAQYLRDHGRADATVRSLVAVGQSRPRNGITHARFGQRVAGLQVYATYVKAAIDAQGELIHIIENLAPVPAGGVERARVDEQAALRAALQRLHPRVAAPAVVRTEGDTTVFARTAFFHAEPRVTRVAVPDASGGLAAGFLVETWTQAKNLLHHTLVSGDGAVLEVELRTNTDQYKIFRIDPERSTQQTVEGPAPGGALSPDGWLGTGTHTGIHIAGNNVRAYRDADSNDRPDAGGTPVTDGSFVSTFDAAIAPTDVTNRAVAVQNLFYLNNVLHDTLYLHGFDEAAGNFQETNFTGARGGSDSVNAEAQDGGGTDNANFATPGDGRNPRMQMYLWTGKPSHQVAVTGGPAYPAAAAVFGPQVTASAPLPGSLAIGTDGTGASPGDACESITSAVSGSIAVVDRGNCDFTVKVKNAQLAGAIGVVVANNQGDSIIVMGGTDTTITIPALFVGQSSGTALKAAAGEAATLRVTDPTPLQRDGDLDSDIVYHEYGHGLTWRMIGRMNGPLASAIGEGMSDVLAMLLNNNDVIGEYSASDPLGIRRNPYTNYPRTYAHVTGAEEHNDGEIYAAIGWRLWENFQAASLSRDVLLGYLVRGMNFTPAQPTFEQMRDGILQAVATTQEECLVWDAFADFGVGVGAQGVARGSSVVITPSTDLPASCQAIP